MPGWAFRSTDEGVSTAGASGDAFWSVELVAGVQAAKRGARNEVRKDEARRLMDGLFVIRVKR